MVVARQISRDVEMRSASRGRESLAPGKRRRTSNGTMSKTPRNRGRDSSEIRPEYRFDYSRAKPNRFASGMNPPVIASFSGRRWGVRFVREGQRTAAVSHVRPQASEASAAGTYPSPKGRLKQAKATGAGTSYSPHLDLLRPERCEGGHRTIYAGRPEANVVMNYGHFGRALRKFLAAN
jgi:hypothetical protein